jgi:hypothetical protein
MHETLSSSPRTEKKEEIMLGVVAWTYDFSTQEVKAVDLKSKGFVVYIVRRILKRKKVKNNTMYISLISTLHDMLNFICIIFVLEISSNVTFKLFLNLFLSIFYFQTFNFCILFP